MKPYTRFDINSGKTSLDQFLDSEKWVKRILKCLKRQGTTFTYKVHCIKLLQYLCDVNPLTISDRLHDTVKKVTTLPALRGIDDDSFDNTLKDIHEQQKTVILQAISPGAKSTELFNDVLAKINASKQYGTDHQASYTSLVAMAANLSEQQFIDAVTLCFNKAIDSYCYSPNIAWDTLFELLKQAPTLPAILQTLFIKTIENNTKVGYQNKDFADSCSFKALSLFANKDHLDVLTKFTDLILVRINDENQHVQSSVLFWVGHAAMSEALFKGTLEAVIANKNITDQGKKALKTLAKKLSYEELTNYIDKYLLLLESEINENKILGCRILGDLASHLSPCPEKITLPLIALAEQKSEISYAAISALTSIEPTALLIKNGIINDLLPSYNNNCAFEAIIKLAPVLSSEDITDEFIRNLINSRTSYYSGGYELKIKAINELSKQFSESQLKFYVSYCLETWKSYPSYSELTAVPTSLLKDQLEPVMS